MRYIILLSLFLAGCNSLAPVNAGLDIVDVAGKLGLDADTNGVYYKHRGPIEHVCEYKVKQNFTAFRPC